MQKVNISAEGQGVVAWAFCAVSAAMLIGVICLFL